MGVRNYENKHHYGTDADKHTGMAPVLTGPALSWNVLPE